MQKGSATILVAAAVLLSWGAFWCPARADDAASTQTLIYRVSDLRGMAVKNPANENLGKVEDLVIDLKNGHIRYAVVSFGGALGVGNKYFAVPFKAMTMQSGEKGKHWHMVLDVPKDRLKNAPGFDKDNWPDFADPSWGTTDQFYSIPATTATKTSPPTRKK